MDGAALEPCCGRAEDKVGCAFDITIGKEHAGIGSTGIDGVLMSEETTVGEAEAVTFGMKSYCLSERGRVILDGDIFQGDIGAFDLQGIGAEGTDWHFPTRDDVRRGDIGMIIVGDDGAITILSAYLDVGEP